LKVAAVGFVPEISLQLGPKPQVFLNVTLLGFGKHQCKAG
jgi:hypothetical protein